KEPRLDDYPAGCGFEGAVVSTVAGVAARARPTLGPSQRSMSSMRVKAAGTTIRVRQVEVRRPPITATAMGARNEESPCSPRADGSMPAIIATVVITMGRARL